MAECVGIEFIGDCIREWEQLEYKACAESFCIYMLDYEITPALKRRVTHLVIDGTARVCGWRGGSSDVEY